MAYSEKTSLHKVLMKNIYIQVQDTQVYLYQYKPH